MFQHIKGQRWEIYRDIVYFLKLEQARLQREHSSKEFSTAFHNHGKPVPAVIKDLEVSFERVASELERAHKSKTDAMGKLISDEVIAMNG